jgi:hypothetical protein
MKSLNGSSIPIKRIEKYGKKTGLQLELFIGFVDDESPVSIEKGAILYVKNLNETITKDDHGIYLKPNYHTNIEIKRKKFIMLPYPFNICISKHNLKEGFDFLKEKFLYELTKNLTGFYNQKYCFHLCYQYNLIKNCQCYDDDDIIFKYFNYNNSIKSCNKKYFEDSINSNYFNYIDMKDYLLSCPNLIRESFYASDYVKKCSKYCPKHCEQEIYETTISKSKFTSNIYLKKKVMSGSIHSNDKIAFRKTVLSLNIYFQSDNFAKIEQVPLKTPIDLISEIGELASMFLGLSILSSFELIELILKIFFFALNHFNHQIKTYLFSLFGDCPLYEL